MIVLVLGCAAGATRAWAQGDAPSILYAFNTLALGGEEDVSYVDRFPGNDMLPYTADDFELPERGNLGGTWGSAHFDVDSDGVVDEDEHIFTVIRRDDDDAFEFSAMNRPEYGVLYEAEDWIDYHEARNEGPSATLSGDLGAEGNDFEHNDRPGFEDISNAYLYNNLQANQHGKGKPKYYFENINPSSAAAAGEDYVFDEIEGYEKPLGFQNNGDDPETKFDERGDCRNGYMRTYEAVTRGYLIPVEDLAGLEDGSLPSLFGWEPEGFDLAAYLRDVIRPKLSDPDDPDEPHPDLTLFHPANGTQPTNLPITHFMLLQIETPIDINRGEVCAADVAQAHADYWGLPLEGATYRASHLLGYNDLLTEAVGYRSLRTLPEDEARRNLWVIDHFFRNDATILGRYTFSPAEAVFTIVPDPAFRIIDNTNDKVLSTADGGMVRASLPRALQGDELPIEVVADLAGTGPGTSFQIALLGGGAVKAYAELSRDGTRLRLGGSGADSGWISGGEGPDSQDEAQLGDSEQGEYPRYVLQVTPDRISLLEAAFDAYDPASFINLNADELVELVGLDVVNGGGLAPIDEIAIAADGPGVVSTIALFAAPPGSFVPVEGGAQKPGDCNQDGSLNIADGICLLGHLFLGNPATLPCGDGTAAHAGNLGVLDADSSASLAITDAVRLFGFLFLGASPPDPCTDAQCTACVEVAECPTVCE